MEPITDRVRLTFGEMNSRLAEAIDGIETVKGAAQEEAEIARFSRLAGAYRDARVEQGHVEARFLPLLLLGLTNAIGFAHAFLLHRTGALAVGDIIAYMGLLSLFGFPTFVSLTAYSQVSLGLAGARRILELINRETDLDENQGGYQAPIEGHITFEDVTFGYVEGVDVLQVHTIGDHPELMRRTLEQSLDRADLVITTGGLGPTHDDVTKKVVQNLFDVDSVTHEPTLNYIQKIFAERGIPFSESNRLQAVVPENAEVLFNRHGTAPGLWFEEKDSLLAVLPGIPHEMKGLMEEKVWPHIQSRLGEQEHRFSRYILTAGIGESTLSDKLIGNLDRFLSDDLSVAYLPSPWGARIRISGYGESREEVEKKIKPVADHIYEKAADVIVGEGKEMTLSEALGNLLRQQAKTISVAESCTGGRVADSLTDIPGSSDYLLGGVIAYSNASKESLLEVKADDLEAHGAVSRPVALQMAKGVAQKFQSDVGISTTGIAGPGGGTEEKPVGTVWIGIWTPSEHFAIKARLTDDRNINKKRSTAVALETVRRSLLGIKEMPYDLKKQPA